MGDKLFKLLKNAIEPDVIVNFENKGEYLQTCIIEDNSESKFKKVVYKIPKDEQTFMMKFDSVKCKLSKRPCNLKSPFFNNIEKDINKGCDYIICSFCKGQLYIILIECKSNKHENNIVKKQLFNGKCFMQYLNSLLEYHSSSDPSLVKYMQILIYTPKASKLTRLNNRTDFVNDKKNIVPFLKKQNFNKNSNHILTITTMELVKQWEQRT